MFVVVVLHIYTFVTIWTFVYLCSACLCKSEVLEQAFLAAKVWQSWAGAGINSHVLFCAQLWRFGPLLNHLVANGGTFGETSVRWCAALGVAVPMKLWKLSCEVLRISSWRKKSWVLSWSPWAVCSGMHVEQSPARGRAPCVMASGLSSCYPDVRTWHASRSYALHIQRPECFLTLQLLFWSRQIMGLFQSEGFLLQALTQTLVTLFGCSVFSTWEGTNVFFTRDGLWALTVEDHIIVVRVRRWCVTFSPPVLNLLAQD